MHKTLEEIAHSGDETILAMIEAARSLASDGDGANLEYDRALTELCATVLGLNDLYADSPAAAEALILGRTPNQ